MNEMATLDEYAAEAKQMHDTSGPSAEIPVSPKVSYGQLTASASTAPVMPPVAARIAELAQRLAETGHMLTEARQQYLQASSHKEQCEASFAQVADDLMRAIHEHREGTPEGVPYR